MNAYRKWKNIKEFMPVEKPEDFLKDVSPTRKRGKIITYVYGEKIKWVAIVVSVLISYVLIGNKNIWLMMFAYPIACLGIFLMLYFIVIYKIAYIIYEKEMKK